MARRLELPDTRLASLQFYADLEEKAGLDKKDPKAAWKETERWLGRNDLFYLLVRLLRRPDMNHDWLFDRCREVEKNPNDHIDLWAREHGKDCAMSETVKTVNRGWVNHGDLIPGDFVFAPNGSPVKVLAVPNYFTDSECYKITFSDGSTVVCGSEHLWRIRRKVKRRIGDWRVKDVRSVEFVEEILTTRQMIERGGRLDVGVCEALKLPDAELPIDPYVFGVWLGDGASSGTRVTSGLEDADWMEGELRGCGIEVNRTNHSNSVSLRLGTGIRGKRTSSDMANALRSLGVMGNKHIPNAYMNSSIRQRIALLQGLMDTDGCCNTRGTATFCQADENIANQVYDLVASLGLQPRLFKGRGKYNGGNDFWLVNFQAHTDRNPFRMPRKVVRAIAPSHYRGCRTVQKIESVPSVPTNCITVEGGLYCVGKQLIPTHNSSIITFALTIKDILNDPEITVGIFSFNRPTARAFLSQIMREFETNNYLKWLYPDILYADPRKESPKWGEEGGIIVKRRGNPKESTCESWGLVDGQPTGRHFRLRVYDDVVTRESVTTADQIKKTTDAWELSENLGVAPERGGAVRYIGTRYHLNDSYAEMLRRKAVTPRLYPATHNGKFDGKPVYFSDAYWARLLRTRSRQSIAAQQLQNPMADEDATFRPEWLRSYEIRPRTLNVYIMADPSKGRGADSDNTAMSVVGVASNGAKYLLDGVCHRMTLSQRWTFLRGFYRKWSATPGVQHVAVGYERYGAQSDDEYFQEQMLLDHKKGVENAVFDIEELNWVREGGQSKRERVERLEPDFRNSRFYLPLAVLHNARPATWRVETNPEAKNFQEIEYTNLDIQRPLTALQLRTFEAGSPDLIAKAIKCYDQDRHVYDLTTHFISEYVSFPHGRFRDLVDATSRVFDMEPIEPTIASKINTDPPQFWDR